MGKYIDKDTLVAEIKRRKKYYENIQKIKPVCQLPLPEGRGLLVDSIEDFDELLSFIGTLEAKEVDTENHINCKIGWYDGMFLDYTQEQLSTLLDKIGANVGDEVKIYITK
jgi:hypothetical protein